jgi:hypothetical protein
MVLLYMAAKLNTSQRHSGLSTMKLDKNKEQVADKRELVARFIEEAPKLGTIKPAQTKFEERVNITQQRSA